MIVREKRFAIGVLALFTLYLPMSARCAENPGLLSSRAPQTNSPAVETRAATNALPTEDGKDKDEGYKEHIGFDRLTNLFANVPNGSISSVVDVDLLGMPDIGDSDFDGKTISLMDKPGRSRAANNHATRSLKRLCGNKTSITPAVDSARCYTARKWVEDALRPASESGPLSFSNTNIRVVSHSWLDVRLDPLQAVRRTDAMIDRDGILQVFAAANEQSFFPVFGNSYNAMLVGRVVDWSSEGPTRLDVTGRAKPDIMAPLRTTSQATPCVGAAVTLLAEAAILQGKPDGARPYVIKSLLMTGAGKVPANKAFGIDSDWHRGADASVTDHAVPLDFRQGAGVLRLDRSYAILQQPQTKTGESAAESGWACDSVSGGQTNMYFFTLEKPAEYAATLVWHRHIPAFGAPDDSLLNDLDLHLCKLVSGAPAQKIDWSVSKIDNVEHIYQPNLPPGKYALAVAGAAVQGLEAYGLSWDAQPASP